MPKGPQRNEMERLLTLGARWPRVTLLVILLVSVLAASQLPKLQIQVSPQSLVVESDPAWQTYKSSVATFGSDNITVVYLADAHLFDAPKIEAIRQAVARLEALPFVSRTQSLFSVPEVRVVGDLVTSDPFLAVTPTTPAEVARIRAAAAKSPFVKRNLLSGDGTAMAVNVHLREGAHDPGFEARAKSGIEDAIAPLTGQLAQVFQIGAPSVRTDIADRIRGEQSKLIAGAVAVLLVSLLMVLRRLSAIAVPMLIASLSVLWLLGALAALGVPLSIMTAIVPVLITTIGSHEAVHLLVEYYQLAGTGYRRLRAVRAMAARMAVAVSLTFLTTYLGFLSASATPIELVREFGLVASSGLAINFLLTVLLLPAYLALFGEETGARKPAVAPTERQCGGALETAVAAMVRSLLARRPLVLAVALALLGMAGYASLDLRVNNSLLAYFQEGDPVKVRAQTVHEHLSGVQTFSILVNGHLDGAFLRVKYLGELAKIQHYLATHPAFDSSVSFADYVGLLNSAANDSGEVALPDDDNLVETLLLFVKHRDIREYVSADFSQASILVRHNLDASEDLHQALAELRRFIDRQIDHRLDVDITGNSVLANNAVDYLARGQVQSLALILGAIFIIITVLFASPKAGFLAVVPNLVPMVAVFGLMGVVGIPLDSATAMIATIALGLSVNHTVHLMVRYRQELRARGDEKAAIESMVRCEIGPITTATVTLAAGFAVLALSDFKPLAHFGMLSAFAMAVAYLANFLLTPILLSYTSLLTLWELLATPLRRELVESCALFRGMRPHQIKRVVLTGRVDRFEAGQMVMARGDHSREMFVLLDGAVQIETERSDGSVSTFHSCSAGGVFGVAALVCARQRIATAVARAPTSVLSLDWPRIQQISRFYPRTAALLFRNLSALIGERLTEQAVARTADRVKADCREPELAGSGA